MIKSGYLLGFLTLFLTSFIGTIMAEEENNSLILAGGCFWCMETAFDKVPGVLITESGYSGGEAQNPTYEQVSSGTTGHYEVIKVTFDPKITTKEALLEVFWENIDPMNPDGQFCDIGPQYQTAILYQSEEERLLAEKSKGERAALLKKSIYTKIVPNKHYTRAEEHHQDFYKKSPLRYNSYRLACGRDKRLKEIKEEIFGEK